MLFYSGDTFNNSESSGSGLGSSFADGFVGGAKSTWNFVKGQFFGQSYWDGLANTFSMGIYGSIQTAGGISNAVSNIPNYTANDYAYGAGFFTEKAIEALVFKRVSSGSGAAKGVTSNPFKGKTFSQIDEMFKAKGFTTKGVDPLSGKGSYFSPSGTRYYLDKGGV